MQCLALPKHHIKLKGDRLDSPVFDAEINGAITPDDAIVLYKEEFTDQLRQFWMNQKFHSAEAVVFNSNLLKKAFRRIQSYLLDLR